MIFFVNRQGIKAAFYLVFHLVCVSQKETGVSSFSLCAGMKGLAKLLDSRFIAVCGIL